MPESSSHASVQARLSGYRVKVVERNLGEMLGDVRDRPSVELADRILGSHGAV